jgi:hypothetical protein
LTLISASTLRPGHFVGRHEHGRLGLIDLVVTGEGDRAGGGGAVSSKRRRLQERIDFIRSGRAVPTEETPMLLAQLISEEQALSLRRRELHAQIDPLRVELGQQAGPRKRESLLGGNDPARGGRRRIAESALRSALSVVRQRCCLKEIDPWRLRSNHPFGCERLRGDSCRLCRFSLGYIDVLVGSQGGRLGSAALPRSEALPR